MLQLEFLKGLKMYQLFVVLILTLFHIISCLKSEKSIIEDLIASPKLIENEKFFIVCQIKNGPVSFEWLLNGRPIVQDDKKVFTINQDESSMLNIKQMNLDHAGDYTCKITNSINEQDSRTISVKLNGKSYLDNQLNCKYNLTFCL